MAPVPHLLRPTAPGQIPVCLAYCKSPFLMIGKLSGHPRVGRSGVARSADPYGTARELAPYELPPVDISAPTPPGEHATHDLDCLRFHTLLQRSEPHPYCP